MDAAIALRAKIEPTARPYIPEFDAPEVYERLRKLKSKAGSAPIVHRELADPSVEIARLAGLDAIAYDREREHVAEMLGCRVTTVDKVVRKHRGEAPGGRTPIVAASEPHPSFVEGAALLDELAAIFKRFLALPNHADTTLALWVLHTYAFEASAITPRLAVTAPEKRCGKTTLLEIVAALASNSQMSSNITSAATFRLIEMARPTLLIDEADTFLAQQEELRGVLNSGHRRMGQVVRVEERNGEFVPVAFSTLAPVAIAMIGKLPSTLADRSIEIRMRRRSHDETVERWRCDIDNPFVEPRGKAARWALDYADLLRSADPDVPAELHDRAADNWRPLLAIADAAGGAWPTLARRAAVVISAVGGTEGRREMLLADIRTIFADRGDPDWIKTDEIVKALIDMSERPWSEASRGKPLNPSAMRSLLEPFRVFSSSNGKARGYRRTAFAEAWSRYLVPTAGNMSDPSTRHKSSNGAASGPSATRQGGAGADGSASAANPHERRPDDGLTGRAGEIADTEEISALSAAALLTRLQNAGASVRHDDGKLLIRAPTGRLTPDLVEELRHRKPLLLAILAGDRCRYCEDAIDWRRPHAVAFGDGTGAHLACYEEAEVARLLEAGRRAVESPDALADTAEAMLKGLV